jgi:hypothetical protein
MELWVGDRVLYDGKRWLVASLERHAFHGEEAKTLADGELHAVLELDPDPPGSQAPFRAVVPKSRWDDVRLLEG